MRTSILVSSIMSFILLPDFCLASESIVGSWVCGPYTMEGRGIKVIAADKIEYKANGRYYSNSESTTEIVSQSIVIGMKWSSIGSWEFRDSVLYTSNSKETFISSDNQKITKEIGQRILDDESKKKSESSAKITFLPDGITRRPVDPIYEEADIEVKCTKSSSP